MKKQDISAIWKEFQEEFDVVCQQYDRMWRQRHRIIDTKLLVIIIFQLVLDRGKQGYGTVLETLWQECEDFRIRLESTNRIAASSLSDARQKLSEDIFRQLNDALVELVETKTKSIKWKRYRVFAVDTTKINLPRELIELDYQVAKEDSFYPLGMLSCLYELQTGIAYDFELAIHHNERLSALHHAECVGKGDLVIYDRGYFGYLLLKAYQDKGAKCVFRLPSNASNKDIKRFWKDKFCTERIISYQLSPNRKREFKQEYPEVSYEPIPLRLVRYQRNETTYVLATTLSASEATISELADLYHARWGIEELFKLSKSYFSIQDCHARSERGVKQELYAHFVLVTITKFLSLSLMSKQGENSITNHSDSKQQINLNFCLTLIKQFLTRLMYVTQAQRIKKIWIRLLACILKSVYMTRPSRSFPRISRKPRTSWNRYSSNSSFSFNSS